MPLCKALLCDLVLSPQNKFRPHVFQTMNSRLELGKHLTVPPFPHTPPFLPSTLPLFLSFSTSPRCNPLLITHYLHMSHRSILVCLFSHVRSHLSLWSFYPTAAWGQVKLSVKWMMGNWVPAERVWCDLLTYCLSKTPSEQERKRTVGQECIRRKSQYFPPWQDEQRQESVGVHRWSWDKKVRKWRRKKDET